MMAESGRIAADIALIRERLEESAGPRYRWWDDWLVGEIEGLCDEIEALRAELEARQ
jgi:hypothetical protein